MRSPKDSRPRVHYDQALKYWAAAFPADLAEFLLGEHPLGVRQEDSVLAYLLETAPRGQVFRQRLTDKILDVAFASRRAVLLHVEFVVSGSAHMPERTLGYLLSLSRLLERSEHAGKSFGSVAIHLEARRFRGDPGRFSLAGELGTRLECSYGVRRLWEEDPAPYLEGDRLELFPLVPLMRGDALELLVQSKRRLDRASKGRLSRERRADLLAVMVVLAALRIESDEGRRALEALWKDVRTMEESEFLNQVLEDGLERGLERGRLEEARTILENLLARRFGPLEREDLERVRALERVEDLEALIERAALAGSLDEVRRHFA